MKTLAEWMKTLSKSIITLDTNQHDTLKGIRIALFTVAPLLVGLATNQTSAGFAVALGAFNLSIPETPDSPTRKLLPLLALSSVIYAFAFAFGTLVAISGPFSIPFFGLGFFAAGYLAIRANSPIIGSTACVLFSVGVGLPGGGSTAAAWARFWQLLAGGLFGLAGASIWAFRPEHNKRSVQKKPAAPPEQAPSNSSMANALQFSVAFGLTGAVGLAITQYWGLDRDYWVLLTLAVLLLRSDVSTTPKFIVLRVIGTIIGALIGLAVASFLVDPWFLVPFVFAFCALYYAMRGLNYGLGTVFLTAYILVLINVLTPGNPQLAATRILNTLVAAGLSFAMVSALWLFSRRKPPRCD